MAKQKSASRSCGVTTISKLILIAVISFGVGAAMGDIGCRVTHLIEGAGPATQEPWFWFVDFPSLPGSWLAWIRSGACDWGVDEQWSFRGSVVLCNAFLYLTAGLFSFASVHLQERSSYQFGVGIRRFISALVIAFVAGLVACLLGILVSMPVYGDVFWYFPATFLLSLLLLPFTLSIILYTRCRKRIDDC